MKALITGGNGFIGTHLVDLLLENGHEVRVLDRYPSRFREALPNVEYLVGDLGNHGEMENAVKDVDWVFHLAYTTLPQTSNDDPVYDIRSNVVDTVQLLTECSKAKVKKVIFISSGGTVYGIPQTTPIKENHPNEPICSYGITKLTIEKYLNLFHEIHGLEYVVARLSNPYGELQNPNAKQGAIGVFLGHAARGETITIWGDGEVVRDYLYIRDTVEALLAAALYQPENKKSPRVFNISSGIGRSLNDLIAAIKQVAGPEVKVEYTPARAVDVPANVLDNALARQHLDWEPQVGLTEGIEKSWRWINSLQPIHK
jgi:UDP-glucose 4-epimerase